MPKIVEHMFSDQPIGAKDKWFYRLFLFGLDVGLMNLLGLWDSSLLKNLWIQYYTLFEHTKHIIATCLAYREFRNMYFEYLFTQ